MTDLAPAAEFLWGVATSAYQSEGGYNGAGEPRTNWAAAEARGDVAPLGRAADFWTRYEEDFSRCRDLGLTAFRLGIEWSRVQPSYIEGLEAPPPFDPAALDHYARMLAAARRHGLEPIVTLHHFVHPEWLGTDPWLDMKTVDLFVQYVRAAVEGLNHRLADYGQSPLRHYLTINEPNMLALNTYLGRQFPGEARAGLSTMARVCNTLLCAHVAAYDAIHDLHAKHGWREPSVTLNNFCSDLYWSDKLLLDLLALRARGISRANACEYICAKDKEFSAAFQAARLPLRRDLPFLFGSIAKRVSDFFGGRHFDIEIFEPLLDALERSPSALPMDVLAIDYYDPFTAHLFRLPNWRDLEFKSRSVREWLLNTVTSKWWDWRVLPRGLNFFCSYYSSDFKLPIYIAENGLALRRHVKGDFWAPRRDRVSRSEFLRQHVEQVVEMRNTGVHVLGYLHWSLFDNYEWGSYTPRFGLYSLDYARGTERLVEDPFGDRPAETYQNLVATAKERMKS